MLLAFAPFVLITPTRPADSTWEFMGVVHHYQDAAAYLSKIEQGSAGDWLTFFQHTPDPHNSVLAFLLYSVVGQVVRLVGLSDVIGFHLARLAAMLFMHLALYQLAATIWVRVRTRRIFFMLTALGSGFGWLFSLGSGDIAAWPDLSFAQAYPFYSALVNVHFPLAMMCVALLVSVIITAFRPGNEENPSVDNMGIWGVLMSVLLAFIYPEALVPLLVTVGVLLIWHWVEQRRLTVRELRWAMWISIPALPIGAYYVAIMQTNPVFASWAEQRLFAPPDPIALLLALGLPLIIALPGIWRALRRFEADGDRFMILWVAVMLALLYLPLGLVQHATVGLLLPIAYFAARAVEDFWFQGVFQRRLLQRRLYTIIIPVLALGNLFVLFVPVVPYLNGNADAQRTTLASGYVAAFNYLRTTLGVDSDTIVLSAPDVSIWLPSWTGARVVYGHPSETTRADQRLQTVRDWYGATTREDCRSLMGLQLSRQGVFAVDYVLVGPEETALGGATPCLDQLDFLASFDDVRVYRNPGGGVFQW